MCGEMAELVEGARLEIVYGRNVIKGTNPFLSATKKTTPFGVLFFLCAIYSGDSKPREGTAPVERF